MSDVIIKIGDEELDLNPEEVVPLIKQIGEIGDFSLIQGSGTNSIKLPLTAKNKRILDNLQMIQAESEKPYRKLDATVILEGYEVIQNGYTIVLDSENELSLQIVGGNASFFDLLKGKSIRDLDLSLYDHPRTFSVILASRNYTEGIIYPIVDMQGLDNSNNDFDVRNLLPATYIKTIWDKIAEEAGYTWEGEFFSTDIWDKLLLLWSSGKEPVVSQETADLCKIRVERSAPQTVVPTPSNSQHALIDFTDSIYDPLNTFSLSSDKFVAPFPGTYTFRLRYDITNITSGVPGSTTVASEAYINGNTFQATQENNNWPVSIDRTFNVMTLDVGDEVEFYIFSNPNNTTFENTILECVDVSGTYNNYGSFYEVTPNLPDISQTDFVKGIAQMFGLVFSTDSSLQLINVSRFDTVVENIPFALDWSAKLDLNRSAKTAYRADGYAQTTYLRYKADSNETAVEYLGDGSILIDDEHLPLEGDLFTLPFAASPMKTVLEGVQVPFMDVFENGSDQVYTDGIEPRILLLDRQDWSNGVNYTDGLGPALVKLNLPFCYFDLAEKDTALSFTHTLITDHYQGLKGVLNRYKKIDAYFWLSIKDVSRLDHFIPVYISYFGHYFYVQKIHNYVQGKLTKCTLIRL